VRDIAVGKGDEVRFMFFYEIRKPFFGKYGNPVRIVFSRKFKGIDTVFYGGNLGCGKGNHPVSWIIPEVDVKIMEIPPGGAHYDYLFDHDSSPWFDYKSYPNFVKTE